MEQLYFASKGDQSAFDRALAMGTIRSKSVIPKGEPSNEDLAAIADYLIGRLERMNKIGKQIEPDWETYRMTHRELTRLRANVDIEIRKVRLMTLVWVRAHQKMASGRVSPAQWFDIQSAPAQLIGVGVKTVF